ncbi:MAG: hypothetical protein KDB60_19070 [Propionibacteriaceae bacterium]|nr:hypothetical protein [Propionibacteriaceae bacterium]
MYAQIRRSEPLGAIAGRQCGVARRRQLASVGLGAHVVAANLAAERWQTIGEEVVLLQNAPPNRRQLMWVAVLDAGSCALGSHTSLELAGFRSFASEAEQIRLVIPRGDKVTPLDGVRVHESRRLHPEQCVFTDGLPRTPNARSVLDAAAWQPYPRFAATMVAAAVQQRLVTAAELDDAMRTIGRIRHKQYLREAIEDAAVGAQALGELDLTRLCRRFELVQPVRQVPRRDASGGWRYLDAEWVLPNGDTIVLEVDGQHHMDAAHWQADMRRERAIVVGRKWVLRATSFEVRHEPAVLVRDLRALGVPILPSCQNLVRS